jgi:hypothetical protein
LKTSYDCCAMAGSLRTRTRSNLIRRGDQ